jgi:DNA-binding MarR family transcriptional regulator
LNDKRLSLQFNFFTEIGIISQLSRAIIDARLPNGLSVSHFGVLNHLIRVNDGQTPMALARAFQVPKTTMTHTLAGLSKHKLITTKPNPEDARSKIVWLTQKGESFRNKAVADLAPEISKVLTDIPTQKLADIVSSLSDIRKSLDNNRD